MWTDCCYVEHKGDISLLLIVQSDTDGYCVMCGRSDMADYCVYYLGRAMRVAIKLSDTSSCCDLLSGRAIRVVIMRSDTGGYCDLLSGLSNVDIVMLLIRRDKGVYVRDYMYQPGDIMFMIFV